MLYAHSEVKCMYRVIRKSLRDFQSPGYRSQDGHAEGEHVNRGRDTPSFCPTLQVLDTSTLGDAADVNPVIKFLPHSATWLQNWHPSRHQGCTYRAPVMDRKLECLSLCWHAPLRRDRPSFCTAEVGNPGGTYELPCMYVCMKNVLGIFYHFKVLTWLVSQPQR